jgi:hypothetical protein
VGLVPQNRHFVQVSVSVEDRKEYCTAGSLNLFDFFSAPYRTVPYHTQPSIVLKKYRKINEKRHFILKRLAVLTLIFSDSVNRAVS